jgi:hypothetical protein
LEHRDVLTQYILGGLSETERERVEEEYFVNEEAWEKLRAIESDLIDSYARGELPPGQREQFEKYFLASPDKRRRVEFARTFMNPESRGTAAKELEQSPKPLGSPRPAFLGLRPAMRLVATAAALALVVSSALVLTQDVSLRRELRQARADEIGLHNEIQSLQQKLAAAHETGPSGTNAAALFSPAPTVSILLTAGLLRNGKNNAQEHLLPIPATPTSTPTEVLLLLLLESDEYPGYDVILRTAEGREVRRLEGLTTQLLPQGDKVVAIRLPAQLLPRGDYIATLSGKTASGKLQTVDSYSFSVLR